MTSTQPLYIQNNEINFIFPTQLKLIHLKNIHDIDDNQAKALGTKLAEETKKRSIKTQYMILKYIMKIDPDGNKFPIVAEAISFDRKTLADSRMTDCETFKEIIELPNNYQDLTEIQKNTLYFQDSFFYHLCSGKINSLYPSMDSKNDVNLKKIVEDYNDAYTKYHYVKNKEEKLQLYNENKELLYKVYQEREENTIKFCELAAQDYYRNRPEEKHTVLLKYGMGHKFSSTCKDPTCKLTEVFFITKDNKDYSSINLLLAEAKTGVNIVELDSGMFAIEYQKENLTVVDSSELGGTHDLVDLIHIVFESPDIWGN